MGSEMCIRDSRATLRLAGANGMTMKVKVGFMSKTVDWLRVEDNTQPQK